MNDVRIAVTGGRDYGARARCWECRTTVPWASATSTGSCRGCGGNLENEDVDAVVWGALDAVRAKHPGMVLVHGCCPSGADAIADDWATARNARVDGFPADWTAHGRGAGPRRNEAMAASGLTGLIAFPGGRGTADMIRRCEAHGVPVWRRG